MSLFGIAYEYQGVEYRTVVSAVDAAAAEQLFRSQCPHVKFLRVGE